MRSRAPCHDTVLGAAMESPEKLDEAAIFARADAALRTVIDPEMGVNVVDLGLARRVQLRGNLLHLTYQLTSATCPIGGMMAFAMHDALDAPPQVMGVEMEMQEDPPWASKGKARRVARPWALREPGKEGRWWDALAARSKSSPEIAGT